MAIAGPVAPTHKGRSDPNSPFPADATLYIKVNDEQLTADSIRGKLRTRVFHQREYAANTLEVIRHDPVPANLESLDAFNATKEQIFAFEAQSMAASLALCVALVKKMDEAVETELSSHEKWQAGIRKLLPELVRAYNDSKVLCDLTVS